MDFFNDDPFEEIINEFFGSSPTRRRHREEFIRGEREDRTIDFVEDENKVYLIFELPGYTEKEVMIVVKNKELEIKVQKTDDKNIQPYLLQKLGSGLYIRKTLPKFVNPNKFSHTMKNGVLEIVFEKRK